MESISSLFDQVSDGVCLSGADGRVLYMNPAAGRLLGVPPEDTSEKRLCDLLCGRLATPSAPECASTCPLLSPGAPERSVSFEGRYGGQEAYHWGKESGFHRTREWKDLRVRCLRAPLGLGPGSEAHLTLIQDVSAERELERRREDWRNMVAHDLRTPMTAVYAALREVQEARKAKGREQEDELLAIAVRSCRRIAELLDLYLDLAKLEAGLMPVKPTGMDLPEAVRGCVEEQVPLARERDVRVEVRAPQEARVLADPDLLSRVVENLLNNALKFTRKGGRVTLSAGPAEPGFVALSVEDEGPGIPPEELPLLFDRYHQARARREGKLKGTGLGLSFCRQALGAMGGGIRAEAAPGGGARFVVRLPAAPKEAPAVRTG